MFIKRPGNHQTSDTDIPTTGDQAFFWNSDTTNIQLNLTADASQQAGGGKPGGGGGGGNLLTTYTSGDPTVPNANEFNIKIDFSGTWTAKQQAVVTWAADFYSKIITTDIRDDLDLNGRLVDDIVVSVSTGRIDGKGSPLTGNVLAQTGNIVVRDDGTVNEWLPLTASIKLDSTDLKSSALAGTWDAIIAHEMGHIGIRRRGLQSAWVGR